MNRSLARVRFITMLLLVTLLQTATGQLRLSNGDTLKGKLVSEDSAFIVFESEVLGQIRVPKAQVLELKTLMAEQKLSQPVSMVQKPFVRISLPFSYTYGTQSQKVFSPTVFFHARQTKTVCSPPSWATTLQASGSHTRNWKTKSTATFTNIYDLSLKTTNSLNGVTPAAMFIVADFNSNNSLGLGLQQSYGLGFSDVLYPTKCDEQWPTHSFSASWNVDARYIHQRRYAPSSDLDLGGVRIGEDWSYLYAPGQGENQKERFSIAQTLWITPTFPDPSAVQAFGRLALKIPISSTLAFEVTEEANFMNNAPLGKRKFFSKSSTGLVYTFQFK
jgi:hypothetical protein